MFIDSYHFSFVRSIFFYKIAVFTQKSCKFQSKQKTLIITILLLCWKKTTVSLVFNFHVCDCFVCDMFDQSGSFVQCRCYKCGYTMYVCISLSLVRSVLWANTFAIPFLAIIMDMLPKVYCCHGRCIMCALLWPYATVANKSI